MHNDWLSLRRSMYTDPSHQHLMQHKAVSQHRGFPGVTDTVACPQGEPSIFGGFAAEWFPAMVDALIGGVEKPESVGLHYFLLDACVTFLGWPALFPVPPRGGAAPTLMSYLASPLF